MLLMIFQEQAFIKKKSFFAGNFYSKSLINEFCKYYFEKNSKTLFSFRTSSIVWSLSHIIVGFVWLSYGLVSKLFLDKKYPT